MEKPVTVDLADFDHFTSCYHQAIVCLRSVHKIEQAHEPHRASLAAMAQAIWDTFEAIETDETEQRYVGLARIVDALADQVAAFSMDGGENDELCFAAVNLMRLASTGLCRRAWEVAQAARKPAPDSGASGEKPLPMIGSLRKAAAEVPA